MTEYLTGKDYPDLCAVCRHAIDTMHMHLHDLPDDGYVGDEEGPLMAAHDNRLLCVPECDDNPD